MSLLIPSNAPDDLTPEACPHRDRVRCESEREIASCGILREVLAGGGGELAEVRRDACEACCRTTRPTAERINSVLASLLYTRCAALVESGGGSGLDVERATELRDRAERSIAWEVPEELGIDLFVAGLERRIRVPCRYLGEPVDDASGGGPAGGEGEYSCGHPGHARTTLSGCHACRDWVDSGASGPPPESRPVLETLPPPRADRDGLRLSNWAIGVTTAPRARPTLDFCLDSLVRAGWDDCWIFADSAVPLAPRHRRFPVTLRQEGVGAWPNYYLALSELVLRRPDAGAYLLVQDDAVFYDREDLRRYLEEIAWPAETTGAVSLYCSEVYTGAENGWHSLERPWVWGALAFVFPRRSARRFLADPEVFAHRWAASGDGLRNIDGVVGDWATRNELKIYFPTPSLVQHIGDVSTLWPAGRAWLARKADRFAGDAAGPGA